MVRLVGAEKNILKVWERASGDVITEGSEWYPLARDIANDIGSLLEDTLGSITVSNPSTAIDKIVSGAGIISALSPQVEWGENIHYAMLLVKDGTRKHTQANHDKAVRIMNGERPLDVLGGRKVRAFYKAIVAPRGSGEPVIDRHAVAVYMKRSLTNKQLGYLRNRDVMDRVQGAYIKASKILGVPHHQVQAVTWNEWRLRKGIVKSY